MPPQSVVTPAPAAFNAAFGAPGSPHHQALANALTLLGAGAQFVIEARDSTPGAGDHGVFCILRPPAGTARAYAWSAKQPFQLAQSLATACHLVEALTLIASQLGLTPPRLDFRGSQIPSSRELKRLPWVSVPLDISPPDSNLLIFHTQSPKLHPSDLLDQWRALLLRRPDFLLGGIQHTMLVRPRPASRLFRDDQPPHKSVVTARRLPTEIAADRGRFRLLHEGRIADWGCTKRRSPLMIAA